MKSVMKYVCAKVILLALTTGVAAQTTTTTLYGLVDLSTTVFVPCVNSGKGELIAFNAMAHELAGPLSAAALVGTLPGSTNGFLLYAATVTGVGQTTHKAYSAVGTYERTFKNQFTVPDQIEVVGDFVWSVDLNISSAQDHVLYKDVKEFIFTDVNHVGNVITIPEVIVCGIER